MNDKFKELSEEKQLRIIHTAMEVFALNDYKHASTDLIVAKSGVSKGLLFYYFHNKKELFFYVFDYCMKITLEAFNSQRLVEITDFFDILSYGASIKMKIVSENPYITDFIMKAYFCEHQDISEDMKKNVTVITSMTMNTYFKNVDMSKFREEVDLVYLYKLLLWIGDGYLSEQRRLNRAINVETVKEEFSKAIDLFKLAVYKPEYL